MELSVVEDRTVCQWSLRCCRMAITIYQKLVKSFPPTWQHHRLIVASIIVFIILLPTVNGKANPRLDASLLQCTLRSSSLASPSEEAKRLLGSMGKIGGPTRFLPL
jgi:hypothetical protein